MRNEVSTYDRRDIDAKWLHETWAFSSNAGDGTDLGSVSKADQHDKLHRKSPSFSHFQGGKHVLVLQLVLPSIS